MLIGAIEAQLNIINYELKFTLDNGHFITGVHKQVVINAIIVIIQIKNLLIVRLLIIVSTYFSLIIYKNKTN